MSTATNMWEQTESIASRHEGGSGTWIRLQNDGDREVVVFLGEPYPREVVFVDGKYELFSEEHKAAGLKSSLRVAINAAIAESREVKVLEMGVLLFKELAAMRAKRPLHKWSFEVQRHGAAKDPKTRYSLLPEEQLSAEDQAAFAGLDLIDLAALYGDNEAGGDDPILGSYDAPKSTGAKGKGKPAGDSPIDEATAKRIVTALKSRPREEVDAFTAHFGVQRIKDLPKSKVEEALAYVERLTQPEEVDPFA